MATATELTEGRGYDYDQQGIITLTRAWLVDTSLAENETHVASAVGVNEYDSHPQYPAATARTFSARKLEPTKWSFTATYSTGQIQQNARDNTNSNGKPDTALDSESPQSPASGGQQSTPAPERTPEWSYTKRTKTETAEFDVDGDPIVNVNGEPITNITRNVNEREITIKYFSLDITDSHIETYWDKINDDVWNGYAAGTLLVDDFSFDSRYDLIAEGVYGLVRSATLKMIYNANGHRLKVLNAGFKEMREKAVTFEKYYLPILDAAGEPVSEPWPLLANGNKWDPNLHDATDYDYLYFDMYAEADFTSIIL